MTENNDKRLPRKLQVIVNSMLQRKRTDCMQLVGIIREKEREIHDRKRDLVVHIEVNSIDFKSNLYIKLKSQVESSVLVFSYTLSYLLPEHVRCHINILLGKLPISTNDLQSERGNQKASREHPG